MEGSPPTAPPPPAAGAPDPDAEPATQGDLRTLRRWLVVAGVWAVAATAIGVLALIDARDAKDKASDDASVSGADLSRSEKKLSDRVDGLENQIKDLPSSSDVDKLSTQVSDLSKEVDTASENAKSADDATTRLEEQVKALEDAQNSGGGTTTTP